jgi:hypothetical protein
MIFRPIDEMSLRHLFSSAFAQEVLRLSYIGPVLNDTGVMESSPDGMILDMRSSPFRPLRCEFKHKLQGKEDFSHNGSFDVAVVWSLPPTETKEHLLHDLLAQNGCSELIVLSEFKEFRDLPTYSRESLSRLGSVDLVRSKALNAEEYAVFALYIAARIFPDKFHMDHILALLTSRFPKVKKMQAKGRSNAVSAFIQTKPPLITRMHGKYYRWTSEFDSVIAARELAEVILLNFGGHLPSTEDLADVR